MSLEKTEQIGRVFQKDITQDKSKKLKAKWNKLKSKGDKHTSYRENKKNI